MEKPGSDEVRTSLINAGIYVLERQVLNMIPKGREVSIEREIFPQLQATGRLSAFVSSAYWRDIGTPVATWQRPTTCSLARSAAALRSHI